LGGASGSPLRWLNDSHTALAAEGARKFRKIDPPDFADQSLFHVIIP
jgi:hypothetical protein